MKNHKFVGMTNEEWLENIGLCDFQGCCLREYGLTHTICNMELGRAAKELNCSLNELSCKKCFNLPVKINGRYILKEVDND